MGANRRNRLPMVVVPPAAIGWLARATTRKAYDLEPPHREQQPRLADDQRRAQGAGARPSMRVNRFTGEGLAACEGSRWAGGKGFKQIGHAGVRESHAATANETETAAAEREAADHLFAAVVSPVGCWLSLYLSLSVRRSWWL